MTALKTERAARKTATRELADRNREIEILKLQVVLWERRAKENGARARELREELEDLD